jgi:hypothetical protein
MQMIDPVSAFAMASAAFKGVQSLVNAGAEIDDVFSQLSKWAGYTSDIKEWCRQQDSKPSIFKKLSFKSSTEEAIDTVMYRRKIQEQEKKIREMFSFYGPPGAYEEFILERRRIENSRQRMIYNQQRRRQAFIYNSIMLMMIAGLLISLSWLVVFIAQFAQ